MKIESTKDIKDFYAQPLDVVLLSVRIDERKNQADRTSARLVRLAAHITKNGLTAIEAVELLHQEAEAIESQAQELH
ncbi:Protein of uncharacterised function (DUF2732) [Serratia quinivorans]|uniref:DUF2732 domain-containing protein n=1 Tax=Serratia quinivorans TaxID=137545 RepID=UPI00217CAECF|nr:DUF2732 domain-containing protein [Serratia quinivorans]CAI1057993.1 Protein of uncharacterised function (DUF2732) [Serratia quinivorans]CAI1073522.1 Protein of uncharacterised function (DUF2732) [Serratia quinivorans]CAI1876180.1 Protein of uncharacterised function (DUF2732) [Serratia quinivorans]CAI2123149.1 Protein of uncharacterised function (DUF2732) [Serratia quinivorans]CAI2489740.1 Protein of uncharacterised function (DUF2732) [Serratia quinivorans]